MYLDDGREIYESDDYPGYYIDADTGDFCDEEGNPVGGNIDDGDKPGEGYHSTAYTIMVYVSKSGKYYYPQKNKTATIPMRLSEAVRKNYKPSKGYLKFREKEIKKQSKKKKL